jgi:hypothetical protein
VHEVIDAQALQEEHNVAEIGTLDLHTGSGLMGC